MSEVTDLDFFYGGAIGDNVDPSNASRLPLLQSRTSAIAMDDLVGFLVVVPWDSYFTILRVSTAWWLFSTAHVNHYTYQLDGPEAIFLGEGDLHDTSYDYIDTEFAPFMQHNFRHKSTAVRYPYLSF
jgi:hypothetical protein